MELDAKAVISRTKQRIGWAYDSLNWLGDAASKTATQTREQKLAALPASVELGYGGSKPHYGALSPGCRTCADGTWSCLFVNRICNAQCFYCPVNQTQYRDPEADKIAFPKVDDYIEYLARFNFKGVGFTGGEPFIEFDKMCEFLSCIRERFGDDMYVWAYTNGKRASTEKLTELARLGLDEIRYDISATAYSLDHVNMAIGIIDTVTVEIPALPEDAAQLTRSVVEMDRVGVDFLHLHQLVATEENYQAFMDRGYTFVHGGNISIVESELVALDVLTYAADQKLRLPVNYCSSIYKERHQGQAQRTRMASLVKTEQESITRTGLIRRLGMMATRAQVELVAQHLEADPDIERLWSIDPAGTKLWFHHSLIPRIDLSGATVSVHYFVVAITADTGAGADVREASLTPTRIVRLERTPVMLDGTLTCSGAVRAFATIVERDERSRDAEEFLLPAEEFSGAHGLIALARNAKTLLRSDALEHMGDGLQRLF